MSAGADRATEDQHAGRDRHREQRRRFSRTRPRVRDPGLVDPDDQQRREHERSRDVAEPPGQPDRARVGPRRVAAEDQARDADGRAQHRGGETRAEHEREDRAGQREGVAPVREAPHERGAGERLRGVAGGDPQRGGDGSRGGDVGHERAQEDRGPPSVSAEHERGERDPGRRPERGRAGVDDREVKPELGREHVDDHERGKREPPWDPAGRHHIALQHGTDSSDAYSWSRIAFTGLAVARATIDA